MSSRSFHLSPLIQWVRRILGPLLLIAICSSLVMLVWYTNTSLNGSCTRLFSLFAKQGTFSTLYHIWSPVVFGTPAAWKILAIFITVELFLMKALPGKKVSAPTTPQANIPLYKANGTSSFLCTLGLFYLGSSIFKLFSPTIIYDHLGGLLGALTIFSLVFCLFLYLKEKYKPSSADLNTTGDALLDYFWGTQRYPRVFGWDVKMFTNCRFGIMGWGLILISFAYKQSELYGISDSMIVAVSLQLLYIFKFFWWETGYLKAMDIIYDRAGFCICWGSMVWLPAIYTSPTLFLVNHPHHLGTFLSLCILTCGIICIFINYLADKQRHYVRSKNGECTVWKKKPELIFANYKTEWGEDKQSLLLASGWWGISRHFHYLPELLGAFCWSAPALFSHFLPYFHLCFLFLLLADRSYRQEKRCSKKYGKDWDVYCKRVPFRLIPFIY